MTDRCKDRVSGLKELHELIIDTPPGLVSPDAPVLLLRFQEAASYGEGNFLALYTAAEQVEILEMKTESRRQEKLAGKLAVKLLACDILQRWFSEVAEPAIVEVLTPAAPVSAGVPANSRLDALLKSLQFSLSHSGPFVCAAVGRQPVGIDVEQIKSLTTEMVAEIGLSPSLQEPLPLVAFTQKEAVLKAAGIGLREALSAVELGEIALGKGKITMLLTDDFTGFSDPPSAWGEWARDGVEMHRVVGDHKNYVRDHAVTTGQKLGECLSRAITNNH